MESLDVEAVAKHGKADFDLGEGFHGLLTSDGRFIGGSFIVVLGGVWCWCASGCIGLLSLGLIGLWSFDVGVSICVFCMFGHFGVVVVFNIMIGLVTPPYGLLLFIVSRISATPLGAVVRETMPFVWAMIVALVIITFIPETVLWLPRLSGYQG